MKPQRNHPHLINEAIQVQQLLLLDDHKQLAGVKPLREALGIARGRGLDLILVAPQAKRPVCVLGDYGRFLFEHNKMERPKPARQKEVQLSANIFEH